MALAGLVGLEDSFPHGLLVPWRYLIPSLSNLVVHFLGPHQGFWFLRMPWWLAVERQDTEATRLVKGYYLNSYNVTLAYSVG